VTNPSIYSVIGANGSALDKAVANDVLTMLRTLTEADVRMIIREHALLLVIQFYHAVQSGEVQRDPAAHLFRAISDNSDVQRSIVRYGSDLSEAAIGQLQPPALRHACGEVIILARCVHADELLASIIFEELGTLVPELLEELR